MDIQLTTHFHLREFLVSQTATRKGIEIVPDAAVIMNLRRLAKELEEIRVRLGHPMVISSGYRPPWLNEAIGGATNSAHLTGRAADFNVVGMAPETVVRWIRNQGFIPDKCIVEFGRWIHYQVSNTAEEKPHGEFLVASLIKGKTHYSFLPAA